MRKISPVANRSDTSQQFSLESAIEAFVHGFAFTRCFNHPSEAVRVGPLWVVRDGVRPRGDYRREEWIAHAVEPFEVDALARRGTRGRFCLCVIRGIHEPDDNIPAEYKPLGYRFGGTEALMVHQLAKVPKPAEPFPIERVMTAELADRIAKAAGKRQILESHFSNDAPLRQYVALDAGSPVGWARSITAGKSNWVSNVHVIPEYRRRGIGSAILARMLRDDRRFGAAQSVLLASHAGAMLYPRVGYETLGKLYIFTPKKN
jgi:GNAT superfamily N-acetyltransferase